MSAPRKQHIITNLIDADSCTFNKNYRYRILFLIRAFHKVLQEFGLKSSLSEGEKILIDIFAKKAIKEQKKLIFTLEDHRKLADFANREARLFYIKKLEEEGHKGADIDAELAKVGKDFLTNYFIYHFIQYAESICPNVLRIIFVFANTALIDKITTQAYEEDKVIVMLGSNRQSYSSDQANMLSKGTSSIYRELDFLVKYINSALLDNKVVLDKFTLPDVSEEGDFKAGRSFKKILKSIGPYVKNPFCVRKGNILYAVMNYIPKKYPGAEHTFNLFDDQMAILDDLRLFFSANPTLYLKGAYLNLHRYTGKFSTSYSIRGEGVVDYHFEKNVCLMAKMCGYDVEKENDINIAKDLDVKKFLEQRTTSLECVSYAGFFKKSKKTSMRHLKEDESAISTLNR